MTDLTTKRKPGRPKGSRNVKSLEFEAALERCGKQPHEMLLEALEDETLPKVKRLSIAEQLMKFYLPIKKESSIEVTERRSITEMTPAELIDYIESAKQAMNAEVAEFPTLAV